MQRCPRANASRNAGLIATVSAIALMQRAPILMSFAHLSISAEAGPGISVQSEPTPAVEERSSPESMEGDPRATRSARTSDGAARVGRRCGPLGAIRGVRNGGSGAVFKAPALVAGFENVAVMGEPIEQRGRHLGRSGSSETGYVDADRSDRLAQASCGRGGPYVF